MRIWAIADLHLSFGVENKSMDVFGPDWENHADKIASHWKAMISPEDLVLIPGDISWAMRPEEAAADLRWIDALPKSSSRTTFKSASSAICIISKPGSPFSARKMGFAISSPRATIFASSQSL